MHKWRSLVDDPIPQEYIDDCQNNPGMLYDPSCDKNPDIPCYPYIISNPVFAAVNGVKQGYTHWYKFERFNT